LVLLFIKLLTYGLSEGDVAKHHVLNTLVADVY
jgi:hypothetical protein